MKRKIAVLLCLVMCMVLFSSGCKKSWADAYPYSQYNFDDLIQLNAYLGLEVESLTEDQISQQLSDYLTSLQEQYANTEEIKDRAVMADDTVVVDYSGTLNGEAYAVCTGTDKQILIDDTKYLGFDDFKSKIIGATIGTPINFTVTYPSDYFDTEKIGSSVIITLTVKSISVITLPELTDALITEKSNGSFTTLKDYKDRCIEDIKYQAKKEYAWSAAIQASPIKDYPQDEVDRIKASEEKRYNIFAEEKGMTLSDYLVSINITEENYSTKLEQYARQKVGEEILLFAIAKKENIKITEAEYNKACSEWESYGGFKSEEYFRNYYSQEEVITNLLKEQVLTKIADSAVFKQTEGN